MTERVAVPEGCLTWLRERLSEDPVLRSVAREASDARLLQVLRSGRLEPSFQRSLAREAWEDFAARDLLPFSWVEPPHRVFRTITRGVCRACDGNPYRRDLVAIEDRKCAVCKGLTPPTTLQDSKRPATLLEVFALVSRLTTVLHAEELAHAACAGLEPWQPEKLRGTVGPECTFAWRVLQDKELWDRPARGQWPFSTALRDLRWSVYSALEFVPPEHLLGRNIAEQNLTRLGCYAGQARELADFWSLLCTLEVGVPEERRGWRRRDRRFEPHLPHGISFAALPNPCAPMAELAALNVLFELSDTEGLCLALPPIV